MLISGTKKFFPILIDTFPWKAIRHETKTTILVTIPVRLCSSSEGESDDQGRLAAQRGKKNNHQSQTKASNKKKPNKQRAMEEENLPPRRGGQGPKKPIAKEAPRMRPGRGASSQSEPDHQQR